MSANLLLVLGAVAGFTASNLYQSYSMWDSGTMPDIEQPLGETPDIRDDPSVLARIRPQSVRHLIPAHNASWILGNKNFKVHAGMAGPQYLPYVT